MSRKRLVILIAVPLGLIPIAILLIAYVEFLIGTSYLEDFFRWLGWHEPIREFLWNLLL